MLDWLSQIGDFIGLIIDVIIMVVQSTVKFFELLPDWFIFLNTSVFLLPGILVPFVTLGIVVSVVLLIVGRNT